MALDTHGIDLDAKGQNKSVEAEADLAARQKSPNYEPLVSIILFVRNGMPHLERAVKSVLSQSYQNFEYVIQDGSSTDDTVKFLKSLKDPRFKIVSAKDGGPADAFAKAVRRCKGEIIASCLADEELAPDALQRAVDIFAEHPHLGAITGDADITDLAGNIYAKFTGAPFNILSYLNGDYCPYWCSSFFSTNALRFVGIFDERWSEHSLEFEIWCRLAMETDILYVPEIFSKYAHHADQLSQQNNRVEEELNARIEIIRTRMFGPGKYFGENYGLRDVFTLLQLINIHKHLSAWREDAADRILDRIAESNYLSEFNALRLSAKPAPQKEALTLPPHAELAEPELQTEQAVGPTTRPELRIAETVPFDEYILPRKGIFGKIYGVFTPTFIRKMIPRDTKILLARLIGARRK